MVPCGPSRPGWAHDRPTRITHWIDGKPFGAVAERTGEVFDPATGALTGRVDFATSEVMDEAVAAAKAAFAEWGKTSLTKRASVLFAFRELLNERKEELAAIITAEHGKVLSDALGEVTRGLEVVEFACGIPHLLKGGYSENVSTGVDVYSIRQPLGVVGIISPFNFPAMVPMWFFPIAIAAGNTVDPQADARRTRRRRTSWRAAVGRGRPARRRVQRRARRQGGRRRAARRTRTSRAISFVGSTPIAKYVYETGTAHGKRVQALGGAKNHMLVLPDADLDLAADAAVNAGFGSAGERCMAISALVAVGDVADALVAKIAERMATLRTGDGRRGCDMGPLVTEVHRDKVASLHRRRRGRRRHDRRRRPRPRGRRRARRLLARPDADRQRHHRHVASTPTRSSARCSRSSASTRTTRPCSMVNDHPYGNGTAIFTNDGGAARRFQNEVEVGMIGINVPIPVPMAYYSFGGWKASLFGDTHAHGTEGVHFFTRGKVVTSRWLDPSHGGINLGFPTHG